jgi:hypothetical protein
MDQPVIIKLDKEMSYSSFVAFLRLFKVNAKHQVRVTEMSVTQLWALLYSAGYLTTRMVTHIFAFRTPHSLVLYPGRNSGSTCCGQ